MNILKNKFKEAFTILLLFLMLASILTVSVFAEELPTTTAVITVENKLSGNMPFGEESFSFVLIPKDENCPMPNGVNSNTITIQGSGTASFDSITYSQPNTYEYTVQETFGNDENCTYDKTIYNVAVFVTTDDIGNLTAKISVNKKGENAKSANVVFTNDYKYSQTPDHPQTGDTLNPTLWITIACVCSSALLLILIFSRRKKENSKS